MASLVASKFITGFSTVAPPLAGAMGAGLPSFLFYDLLGTVLWAGGGLLIGFIFHRAIDDVLSLSGRSGLTKNVGALPVTFRSLRFLSPSCAKASLRMCSIRSDRLRE